MELTENWKTLFLQNLINQGRNCLQELDNADEETAKDLIKEQLDKVVENAEKVIVESHFKDILLLTEAFIDSFKLGLVIGAAQKAQQLMPIIDYINDRKEWYKTEFENLEKFFAHPEKFKIK